MREAVVVFEGDPIDLVQQLWPRPGAPSGRA